MNRNWLGTEVRSGWGSHILKKIKYPVERIRGCRENDPCRKQNSSVWLEASGFDAV